MSTTTRCDQCEKTISDPSRQITVTNLCTPSGIMMARDFDFCGPDCFWAWTRKWSVPQAKDHVPDTREMIDAIRLELKIKETGGPEDLVSVICDRCNTFLCTYTKLTYKFDQDVVKRRSRKAMCEHMETSPQCVLPVTH